MRYSIFKKKQKKHILVIFKLFIGWKGVEILDVIYWVTWLLDHNISVIEDKTFNNLTSLNSLYILLRIIWV